ncbi:MAG TPA: trehalose-6-phosphate synthase [Vicinamibacterales bacterium]|nr:trehalose-6-phosphate synthase [Vicinamibacterales bacterium]
MRRTAEVRIQDDPHATSAWTAARLRRCLDTCCGGNRVVVLANREPFRHEWSGGEVPIATRTASGLVTALEPLVAACRGVWIGHGSGAADRAAVTCRDGLNVPPRHPAYRLRRVWLDAIEERRYYGGFANEGLWPLCHRVGVEPVFRPKDFAAYARVNEKFATAVAEEADTDSPVVMVQDYHFALAPRMIRERLPESTLIAFWHIPWPRLSDLERCPWRRQLLQGLLASDIVGFQTAADCRAFLDCAARLLDARVERRRGAVWHDGRETTIRPYPISIEWPNQEAHEAPPIDACRTRVAARLNLPGHSRLIVGADRLDYTKGLCEKSLAFERMLEKYPEFQRRVTLVQIAEPSRTNLPAYCALRSRLTSIVERINRRFGADAYQPIILRQAHHDPAEVYEFLRAADVCYVGSLHDGMNLVAKEFVAARDDDRGVLVLSERAGAARQLDAALIVDPYDVEASAEALARALRMPDREQAARMQAMRAVIAEFNSFWWAGQMLQDACSATRRRSASREEIRIVGEQRIDAEVVQEM